MRTRSVTVSGADQTINVCDDDPVAVKCVTNGKGNRYLFE